MKLSKTQSDVLLKLQAGGTLHYMQYMGGSSRAYYFVNVGGACTKAAEALIKKGLVRDFRTNPFGRNDFRLTDAGKEWKPANTAKSQGRT